ncbi:MAG: heavy-metal-associated domain-containing protein [Balneolales bacterium]|nr:heavy-metal-associated domain-containing protein [Balneolales bacterium]
MERSLQVKIEGMTCTGCSDRLKKQLEKHPDISMAEVDHVNGSALVTGIFSETTVAEIIDNSGFTFAGIEAPM